MSPEVSIAGRKIGRAHPPFVVAELSANHNGSIEMAFRIMEAAKDAGAHAIKIQTYTAETITIDHDGPGFVIEGGLWDGNRLYDLYKEAHTPWDWHEALFAKGAELGLIVFSSPFDHSAVEFLEDLGAPAYKIASFELIDHSLIQKCAATGKSIIMSTGMANLGEIDEAVNVAREAGAKDIILLHCTSGYPTKPDEADILTIPNLIDAFGFVTGLSDHTSGSAVPISAVTLGASIIEKHLTWRREDGGPDAAFSLEPDELTTLCEGVDLAWRALGKVRYEKSESELGNVQFRRSLYIVKDLKEGDVLDALNLRSIRPGFGLPPKFIDLLMGKRVNRDVSRGTPMSWDLVG